jgi:hypothetical protein
MSSRIKFASFVVPALLSTAFALTGCAGGEEASASEGDTGTSAQALSIPSCTNGVNGLPVMNGNELSCHVEIPVDPAERAKIQQSTFGAVRDLTVGGTFRLDVGRDGLMRMLSDHRIALPMQDVFVTIDTGNDKLTVTAQLAPSVDFEGTDICDLRVTGADLGVQSIDATFLPTFVRSGLVRVVNGNASLKTQLASAANKAITSARAPICGG